VPEELPPRPELKRPFGPGRRAPLRKVRAVGPVPGARTHRLHGHPSDHGSRLAGHNGLERDGRCLRRAPPESPRSQSGQLEATILRRIPVLIGVCLTVALISVAVGGPFSSGRSAPSAVVASDRGLDSSHRPGPLSSALYGYLEVTLHLSGFNPLDGYLLNLNGGDAQVPTLTSDTGQPDGVFYVGNATAACRFPTLPFYEFEFPTAVLRQVACIVPLHSYGYSGMFDNEFYIEYSYDEALFFGALSSRSGTYSIEIVNLTTGALLMWNTTGKVSLTNQQADYVGNFTVLVFTDNDTAWAWNLESRSAWLASNRLGGSGWSSPIEANNVYWLPERNQFINIEAHGDSGDQVVQLNATFPGGRIHLAESATIKIDASTQFNFVNGIGYNRSWGGYGALSFEAGDDADHAVSTYVVPYDVDGLITVAGEAKYALFNMSVQTNGDAFMGQRYVYTSDYVLGSFFRGVQYLFDPWNGSSEYTNHSFTLAPCANACFEGTYAPGQEYLLDYSATLGLNSPAMYDVVYAYHDASDPFPGNSTRSVVPTAPTGLAVSHVDATGAALTWTQAGGGGILNDTVELYSGLGCSAMPNMGSVGVVTSYNLTGLRPATPYSATVTAWNITGQSPTSPCIAFTTPGTVPPAPTGLVVLSPRTASATLTWTQASGGGVVNNTVELYSDAACTDEVIRSSTGGAATEYRLTSLESNESYSVTVTAWNSTGESLPSTCVAFTTLPPAVPPAPTGLAVSHVGATVATLTWTQASGGIVNNTVELYSGSGCSGIPQVVSVGVVTSYNLTGLRPATAYSATVTAWNATGVSRLSGCANFGTTSSGGGFGAGSSSFDWMVLGILLLLVLVISLAVVYARKLR
jgi:Fibronectin type III domain